MMAGTREHADEPGNRDLLDYTGRDELWSYTLEQRQLLGYGPS